MSRISPVEFVKTLLAMLKEIPEGLLESREHREQGYKIKVKPAKVGSDHWIDVEVEFENMSKETVEKALKRASDLANKLDEKIIEILKLKEGKISRILSGLSLTLPFFSITMSKPVRQEEVRRQSEKESSGVFAIRAWLFVKLTINTKHAIHY